MIGRVVNLNDTPVIITGVAPDSFFGLQPGSRPDYWLPVSAQSDLRYSQNFWNSNGNADKPFMRQPQIRWLSLVTRIKDPRAEPWIAAAINQVYGRDMQREVRGWDDPAEVKVLLHSRVRLDAGDKGLGNLRRQFTAPLLVLMCAAGLVLLIACLNLASLSLARMTARRKEIAVRCSLGASRLTIAGHFLAETLLLSSSGALLAVPVALGASRLLLRWASHGNPMPLDVSISAPMLLFAALAAFLAGTIFGLTPASHALKIDLNEAMKKQAAAVKGMRLPWGRTLIVAEVAFSVILLTGAVLFVRTFLNYADIPLGFSPDQVLSVRVDPMGARLSPEQLLPLYHRVPDRIKQLPGVQSAAFASCGLVQNCETVSGIRVAGQPVHQQSMQENWVTPAYFATVRMHLLSGRLFNDRDTNKKPVWAVINAAAAKRYFGAESPIGQRFGYGGDVQRFQVIGVTADASTMSIKSPDPWPITRWSRCQPTRALSRYACRAIRGEWRPR